MASTTAEDNAPAFAIASYLSIDTFTAGRSMIRYTLSVNNIKVREQLAFVYDPITGSFTLHGYNPAVGGLKRLGEPLSMSTMEVPIAFNPPPPRKKPFATVRLLNDFTRWLQVNSEIQLVHVTH